MSGWTAVDANTNRSEPIQGTTNSGVTAPYVMPATGAQDPVGKLRVSQPQALIDTDFEYGQQPTKWESIGLQNNRQSVYYIPQQPLSVTSITGTSTLTITVSASITIAAGTPIYIQNSTDANANGWWYTAAGVTAGTTFTVIPTTAAAAGEKYNPANTYVYAGYFYSNCGIAVGSNAFTVTSATTITVTTTSPHGLSAGSLIYVKGLGGAPVNVMGAFIVATVPTATTFTYTTSGASGSPTNAAGNTFLYARPSGYIESRPFDGGVAFSAGAAVPNQQLIRQTRRYFRYQSGKGIQFSTGTSLKPAIFITSLTSSSSTVTVTTRFNHNLAVGTVILVQGCNEGGFNGQYTIASVPSPTTFTYTVTGSLGTTTATGTAIRVSPVSWYGSSNRVGFFDQQNGMFFEYDGQTLYAVWRNSVQQLNGTVQVTNGSATVTGTGTQFTSQLTPGDFIVIRGQSYRVVTITNDTTLYISPEYRGATLSQGGYIISKTLEVRVPQSQWTDPLDGTGPSGYILDLTKMQMWYIDYSWYGAGFIRWGLRTAKGQITYVYQQTNNNARFEAYMRSGNMSSHYESNGITPITYLSSTLSNTETSTMNVGSTTGFAPAGTVKVQASGTSGVIEYIAYTGKTGTTLTGLTRAQTGGQGTAQTFTYSATAPISIEYSSPDTAASLSHWGSSVIMDGNFNDDKSLIFNYGTTTAITTTSTTPIVILAIRIAPAVDNGTTGLLGVKEIINRMQLQLTELGLYTTGTGYLINLILNGYASGALSGTFTSPIQQANGITSSLAQVAINTNAVTVTGGESVAAAYTQASGATALDLTQVRDLGNSILGGGTSNTVPTSQAGFYPDGPDILYVVATPLTTTNSSILARLSWKEAQA